MKLIPVIISGGAGSRLWPLSRELHPKPFIPLPGGGTLIRKVYARAAGLAGVSHVVTVTNRELLFLTADEYAEAPVKGVANTFILEPFGRDTAAAIAMAALQVARTEGPDAIMLVLPADHLIDDDGAFGEAVRSAADLAARGRIVTFGIKAERPETGFGYVEVEGDTVLRFVEKPDAKTAAEYVASGRFFWNSGMFCFPARTMIATMEALCPDVLAGAKAALETARKAESGGSDKPRNRQGQFRAGAGDLHRLRRDGKGAKHRFCAVHLRLVRHRFMERHVGDGSCRRERQSRDRRGASAPDDRLLRA